MRVVKFREEKVGKDIVAQCFHGDVSSRTKKILRTKSGILLKNPKHRRLLSAYEDVAGLSGYAMLSAATNAGRRWNYSDGRRLRSVQSWVNKMDGKVAALLIATPNLDTRNLHSKESAILHYRHYGLSHMRELRRADSVRLYVPQRGYVGLGQRLETVCRALEKKAEHR